MIRKGRNSLASVHDCDLGDYGEKRVKVRVVIVLLAAICALRAVAPVSAASLEESFEKLPDEERARQLCIVLGIDKIRKDKRVAKADRVKTSIFSQASFADNTVSTKGGAVRSSKQWFHLSFTCHLDAELKHAKDFAFEIGAIIPETDWEDLGLWK